MKLDKLAKQLRRDATANPKKAALLGLMALVAMYFWAPLAWRWMVPAVGKKTSKAGKVAVILTDDPVESNDKAKGRPVNKFRWEKVRQLIERESRMASASYEASWVDPFASRLAEPESEAESTPEAAVVSPPPEVKPSEAGLVLSSVVISPRRRLATINGELYQENDLVSASVKDNPMTAVEFRILRISSQGAQLEREGRIFTLELSKPTLAPGDEIERSNRPRAK